MNRNNRNGMTPKGSFKSPACRQFKSPLNKSVNEAPAESPTELKKQVDELKNKIQDTVSEINTLKAAGYSEGELQAHIEKLHEYNEIKDVGQMLLGRIAVIEGVQSKDLYAKYGLDLGD